MYETIKENGISGSTLKIVAIVCMVLDHLAVVFLEAAASQESFLRVLYYILRSAGRLTFPLMLFLLIEGIEHTGNIVRYGIRIFAFAIISEVPYDLCFFGRFWHPDKQNVLFTLTICLIVIALIKKTYESGKAASANKLILSGLVVLAGCVAAKFIKCEYGYIAVAAVTLMYIFRKNHVSGYCAGTAALVVNNLFELFAFLAVPLIALYNGQRGRGWKYFFYVFYPAHILVLWMLQLIVK